MKTSLLISLTLYFSLSLFSQTGPGGVGNSTDNVLWLESGAFTYGSTPYISSWNDQSGNGNDFTQADPAKQPYKISYGTNKSVRFNSGEFLSNNGIAALNTNTSSQFFIYNGWQSDHIGVLYQGAFNESTNFYRVYRSNSELRSYVRKSPSGLVQNSTANNSSYQIFSSIWDGGAETFDSYKDGTLIGSQIGANGSPTGNSINTIGIATNGAYPLNAAIAEVIFYDRALNSAERNIVDNFLSSKFSIATSNDLYSYDGTHNYDLIGIGQEADGNNLVAQGKGIVELSIGSMSNSDYILAGHNNTNLTTTTNNVPVVISGGSRLSRTWRVDVTGTPGAVDLVFDVSSLTLSAGSYYVLVDADGDFSAGCTSYGPFVDAGGLVTASSVSLSAGDYFTIASGVSSGIMSIATGDWDDEATWSCNCIPVFTDDVTISAGHKVTASSATEVNDIVIDGTLQATGTSIFNVYGDYTVSASGKGTHKGISFIGSVYQSITNNSSSAIAIKTLLIENASDVRVELGQLQNIGGTFTFKSSASRTAIILPVNGNGFSGDFIVQRYISTRVKGYGDFSPPVSGLTLGQWDSDETGTVAEMILSGVGGVSGDAGSFKSVWDWNEGTQAWDSIIDTSHVMTVGKSVEIYMDDDGVNWNAKTIDSRGTPNYGDVPVAVVDQWNAVGNPYQAFVSWNSLTKPTLNSTYYIWNTQNASYDAATSGVIPPHQGFWVESSGAGTLTFTESAKTGNATSTFWKTIDTDDEYANLAEDEEPYKFVESILKVKSVNTSFAHELKLRLSEASSLGLDMFDATFLKSRIYEAPSITSFSTNSNKELAINSFSYEDEVTMPIKVNVGVTGEYFIEPIAFAELANDYQVMELKDKNTGRVYDLTATYKEGIKVTIAENDDSERFTLRLSNLNAELVTDENSTVNIYKSYENTVIEFSDAKLLYYISIYNTLGQKIIETSVSGEDRLELNNSKIASGINIITVKSVNGMVTKKINY